jgi:predicted nucleotide-binding protein
VAVSTTYAEQLRAAAAEVEHTAVRSDKSDAEAIRRVIEAADKFGRASSGSNFGFHSCVYYKDFQRPPPGAHFSSEWGLRSKMQATTGDWIEYDRDEVTAAIFANAGDVDLEPIKDKAARVRTVCEIAQATATSVLSAYLQFSDDSYIADLKTKIEGLSVPTEGTLSQALLTRFSGARMMSRDTVAIGQGIHLAPHEVVYTQARALELPFEKADELATLIRRAADHIDRITQASPTRARQVGTRVFIGHGRSLLWRELKDFVADRLDLPYDEFNRVPIAGTTNVDRLSEMLDNAAVAFLILTAEDERDDGTHVARQNVVHEAGLLQGRLGFSRAIVMLEDGCEPFSNIDGLGQLRFPAGHISAVFEEVRRVLEREGLIEPR